LDSSLNNFFFYSAEHGTEKRRMILKKMLMKRSMEEASYLWTISQFKLQKEILVSEIHSLPVLLILS